MTIDTEQPVLPQPAPTLLMLLGFMAFIAALWVGAIVLTPLSSDAGVWGLSATYFALAIVPRLRSEVHARRVSEQIMAEHGVLVPVLTIRNLLSRDEATFGHDGTAYAAVRVRNEGVPDTISLRTI